MGKRTPQLACIRPSRREHGFFQRRDRAVGTGKLFLEDLTTSEVGARLESGCTVAIIFNGGREATGPALAFGNHIFRARAYGDAIAHAIGDATVAPKQRQTSCGPILHAAGPCAD